MGRFEVRPVASQTKSDSWSHTLILSDSTHLLDVATQPVWIISLSLTGENASERGPILSDKLSNAYQQIELKIPEALYQTLQLHVEGEQEVNLVAVCFTLTNATIIGKGKFRTEIWRNQKQSTLLAGSDEKWQVVEGKWNEDDRWWLMTGDESIIQQSQSMLMEPDIEIIAESLHSLIATNEIATTANVLISYNKAITDKEDASLIDYPTIIIDAPKDPKIINKRRVMALGWFVLILLTISVFFGARARSENLMSKNFSELENQVNTSITRAQEQKTTDQIQARATMREVQELMNKSQETYKDNKKWLEKWEALNITVTNTYQQLAGEVAPTELPEWFALSVVKSGFIGDKLALSGNNLIILDKQSTTVVKIDIDSKNAEVVTGGDTLKGTTAMAIDGNRAILTSDTGILEVSLTRKTVTTIVEPDATWTTLQSIGIFNNNLYLLDSGVGEIWRYPGTASGVGAKQRWLGEGVTIPTTDVVGMAVDGDVWLLQSTGSLKRYRRGAGVNFSLTGLDIPLASTNAFSVSLDQDIITILDVANSRIVKFDKEGKYQKQMKWEGLSNAQDIALAPDGNTIYILRNGSIYTAQF